MKFGIIKSIVAMITAATMVLLTGFQVNAAKRLVASVADWTGGEITCQVAVSILEQELDYKIKRIVFPSGTALDEAIGAGDIDFGCESWPSYTEADTLFISEFGGDGSVLYLGPTGIVGMSDYYVPKYFVDANPDFKGWEDLNKYKDQFASIESGDKGRLIGCPVPGWNCYDQQRLDMLGIDFVADELGTETAAVAEASAAYQRGEAFLLYLWEPHWFFGAYEMVGVGLPDNKACDTWNENDGYKECGPGYWPATGWAKDITFNRGNPATFAKPEHADALAFFKKMNFSNADQAKMLVEVDQNGRDIVEVVQEWKDNNEDVWRAWLP